MTFSIVARDARTGELGVATATAGPAVGSLVPHARSNSAAIATQAMTNPYLAFDMLEQVDDMGVEAALTAALSADPEGERRQVIAIDAQGRIAAWTGAHCQDYAGHIKGDNVAVAGNILAGERVLQAMLEAASTPGPLTDRLLAALLAGQSAGGDKRGINSAALKIYGREAYPNVDLRVDWSAAPLSELSGLMERTLKGGYADFFGEVTRRGIPHPPV